jgi:hypothetical protein
MRATEYSSKTITGIESEGGSVVCALNQTTIGVFDHRVLAAKLARLMPLYPVPLPLPEPYQVLKFRQVAMPPSHPIAIDTRRPLLEAIWKDAS